MCKWCNSDWKQSGLNKRDFQHSKDGPEEITGRPRRKSKWCKGKEGREHDYQQVVWYTRNYTDPDGKKRQENVYRWACKGCGKVAWGKPQAPAPKHDHCFCITRIGEQRWKKAQEIYEECCICGNKGRSYKFYE